MKNLKFKATSAALLLTLFAVGASAQPQQQPRKGGKGGEKLSAEKIAEISTDKLDQKLELTDAQESKIYAINLKYAQEREAKMEEMKAEREAKKAEKAEKPEGAEGKRGGAPRPNEAQMSEMKEKQEAAAAEKKAQMVEIMSILTDEQKVEYALLIAESKPKGAPQGKRGEQGQKGQKGQQGPKGQDGRGGQNQKGGKPEGEPRQE